MMQEEQKITKAQILQELDRLPDEILVKVWEYAKSFDTVSEERSALFSAQSSRAVFTSDTIISDGTPVRESSILDSTRSSQENSEIDRRSRVRQAYLASKKEREEVYRRLANS